ncbi:hypothetical protein [Mycoavidus sp. B2-EB]|uniref:hypothetical protein n=1 Tax=Mycoavidus sp. B2-EB TaxID=2651972 RepID=UPI001627D963|nr:hypothetical protein [Mycoavidus sp. B2-EB]
MWFLKTQHAQRIEQKFSDPHYFVKMMEVRAKLYNKSTSDAINGLREFAQHNTDILVKRAKVDLRPWLPEHMWQHFWPNTFSTGNGRGPRLWPPPHLVCKIFSMGGKNLWIIGSNARKRFA